MKTLTQYKNDLQWKIITATSANDYSQIAGRCLNVREAIDDYTDINRGIRHLVDIETPGGVVKVGLASTAQKIHDFSPE